MEMERSQIATRFAAALDGRRGVYGELYDQALTDSLRALLDVAYPTLSADARAQMLANLLSKRPIWDMVS